MDFTIFNLELGDSAALGFIVGFVSFVLYIVFLSFKIKRKRNKERDK